MAKKASRKAQQRQINGSAFPLFSALFPASATLFLISLVREGVCARVLVCVCSVGFLPSISISSMSSSAVYLHFGLTLASVSAGQHTADKI